MEKDELVKLSNFIVLCLRAALISAQSGIKKLPYYQLEDLEGSGWGYYTGENKGMRERCWKGESHSGEA